MTTNGPDGEPPERPDDLSQLDDPDLLADLAEAHPGDDAVRERLAEVLLDATTEAGEAAAYDGATDQLDRLAALVDDHPEDLSVRRGYAKALFNAATAASAGAPDRADDRIGRLERLAEEYPDDGVVRELLAEALVNAVGEARDPDRIDDHLDRLAALVDDHPGEAGELAKALVNAVNAAGSGADVDADAAVGDDESEGDDDVAADRVEHYLGRLSDLADEHPQNQTVREELAKALVNALGYLDDPERPVALFERTVEEHGDLGGIARTERFRTAVAERLAELVADDEAGWRRLADAVLDVVPEGDRTDVVVSVTLRADELYEEGAIDADRYESVTGYFDDRE